MKSKEVLVIITIIVLGTYFSILGVIEAAGFLKPFAIAVLLTLICIPLCRKLESWKFPRSFSALISVLLSLTIFISFFVIISAQVSNISERWPDIKSKLEPKLQEAQQAIAEKTGLNFEQQLNMVYKSNQEGESQESQTQEGGKLEEGTNSASK